MIRVQIFFCPSLSSAFHFSSCFSLGVSLSSYCPLPQALFFLFHGLGFLKSHPVIMLFHGSGLEMSSTYPYPITNLLDKSPNWNFSSPWHNKAPNNKDKQAVCFLWWSAWSQWRLMTSKLTEVPGSPRAAEWTELFAFIFSRKNQQIWLKIQFTNTSTNFRFR